MLRWGIDLGGTKTEIAVIDDAGGHEVVARERILTNQEGGYESIVRNISSLVARVGGIIGSLPKRIGIGTPGTYDRDTKTMRGCNTLCLNGKDLVSDLAKALNVEVCISNDANCFALAEYKMGIVPEVCPDAKQVVGLILGTGVGSGLISNGGLVYGRHGIAGEWGHNVLDKEGEGCYCGKYGCVETFLSGPSLEKYYYGIGGDGALGLEQIAERRFQDEKAGATIERLLTYFGRAVAAYVNIVDPEVIILGGGVGNIIALEEESKPYVEPFVFNDTFDAMIVRPKLGDSAGVFGAAFLEA